MAKQNYDDSEGRWVNIAGRRVFIKDGENVSEAMERSGKFKKAEKQEEVYTEDDLKAINDTINIYKEVGKEEKNVDDLIEDFKKAFEVFDKKGELSEKEIEVIFDSIYHMGKWEDGTPVYFPRTLVNYLFNGNHPHIALGEIKMSDIEELKDILNYSDKFSKDGETAFYTKSKSREGYYECVMESTEDNYRVFHYQYMKDKNAKKKMKKRKGID